VQETRREAMNFRTLRGEGSRQHDAQVDSAFLAGLMSPTVSILTGFAMAVIVVVGGTQVLNGQLALGAWWPT